MKMLRNVRTAGSVTLRCGIVTDYGGPQSAVRDVVDTLLRG